MNRLFGLIFLVIGAVLGYYGWEGHESISANVPDAIASTLRLRSIWLLVLGAITGVWGLYALFRRNVI